ncbi:E3 ubiquitin-protein ligase RNF5, putative [Babesia caballi]|uniref:RING-type E3 ubiquitin transferase n=1 Tax=Babesia caballi TaxID=5871 RepID=A0AAV4LN23_BABCB|nr:E3 ubiquitin-protein ligase RNF5, putative [Babesia caballi]
MDASEKPGSSADGAGGAAEGGAKSRRQTYDCNICFEDVVEPVVTRCGHLFCWACLLTWMNRPNDHCPVCHAGISKANVIPLYGRGQDSSDGSWRQVEAGRAEAGGGAPRAATAAAERRGNDVRRRGVVVLHPAHHPHDALSDGRLQQLRPVQLGEHRDRHAADDAGFVGVHGG